MKYECGGCNFKTENEAEYKKHKLELGKAFKKAVMKGLRDIPEPQQNRSSKAHVVHPSPKEAPDTKQWLQDLLCPPDCGGTDEYYHQLICQKHSQQVNAIAQHIAEQVEAELEALNAKSYWANVRTDDMRARACIINAHHVVDRLRELRREA